MRTVLTLALAAALLGGCSSSEDGDAGGPRIVVTTTILGDVVREVVGEEATVEVLLPVGADPHEFALSSRDAAGLESADLVVVNGAGFEAGALAVIESARDGKPLLAYTDGLALHPGEEHEHDEEEGHEEEEHEEEHDHGAFDPHFWTDPTLMADGLDELVDAVVAIDGIDADAVRANADAYAAELAALDAEVEALVATVPEADRVLVTNHEVLGYFAERYGFEVVGAVVPSLTTGAASSAADVAELAATIRELDVPAIFAETTSPARLAEALAAEAGEVEVVELFTESLGGPDSEAPTYLDLVRTDARRIVEALT